MLKSSEWILRAAATLACVAVLGFFPMVYLGGKASRAELLALEKRVVSAESETAQCRKELDRQELMLSAYGDLLKAASLKMEIQVEQSSDTLKMQRDMMDALKLVIGESASNRTALRAVGARLATQPTAAPRSR